MRETSSRSQPLRHAPLSTEALRVFGTARENTGMPNAVCDRGLPTQAGGKGLLLYPLEALAQAWRSRDCPSSPTSPCRIHLSGIPASTPALGCLGAFVIGAFQSLGLAVLNLYQWHHAPLPHRHRIHPAKRRFWLTRRLRTADSEKPVVWRNVRIPLVLYVLVAYLLMLACNKSL